MTQASIRLIKFLIFKLIITRFRKLPPLQKDAIFKIFDLVNTTILRGALFIFFPFNKHRTERGNLHIVRLFRTYI